MEFGEMNWVTKMDVGEQVRCTIKAIKHNAKGAPYIQAVDNSNGQFFMINILFEQAEELEGLEDVIMTCTGYNDKGYRILSFDVPSDGNTLQDYFEDDKQTEVAEENDSEYKPFSPELDYIETNIRDILHNFNRYVSQEYYVDHDCAIKEVQKLLIEALSEIHKDKLWCDSYLGGD